MRFTAGVLLAFCGILMSTACDAVTPTDIGGTNGKVYDLVWDGWTGWLELRPDGTGKLTFSGDGTPRDVQYGLPPEPQTSYQGMTGPGSSNASWGHHRVVFFADFPNNRQRFDGYWMTQSGNGFAGITWWGGAPFGFYAVYKSTVGSGGSGYGECTKHCVDGQGNIDGKCVKDCQEAQKALQKTAQKK
jgi:hypothetical protein